MIWSIVCLSLSILHGGFIHSGYARNELSIKTISPVPDTSIAPALGNDVLQLIIQADSVTAFLFQEWQIDTSTNSILGFKVARSPIKLNVEQHTQLSNIVKTDSSYYWGSAAKRCDFFPRIGFKVKKRNRELFIMVATNCDVIRFMEPDGQTRLSKSCDPSHEAWTALGNSIFGNISGRDN